MVEPNESFDPISERCETEVFDPKETSWSEIKDDILYIEKSQFTDPEEEAALKRHLNLPGTVAVLLRDKESKQIVGYTYSIPLGNYRAAGGWNFRSDIQRTDEGKKTSYVLNLALHPEYRNHHLSPKLMEALEKTLKAKGYEFIERDATENYNHAANIQKNYAERIVTGPIPHDSPWGLQVFFRIKL